MGPQRPSPALWATTTLCVEGMTCSACTSAVESAFQGVEGAGEVSVSLVMNRAVVRHDPQVLPASKIVELIQDRGFDATVQSTEMPTEREVPDGAPRISTTTIAIEGMTCGACTSAVESGLKEVAGVRSVNVSLLSERAVVEHDANQATPAQLASAIEDRGFGATVLDTVSPESSSSNDDHSAGKKPQLLFTTVAVEGMTCGACTSSVAGAFEGVEGVVQFDISLLAERAVLIHDPKKITPEQIVSTIEGVGFDARVVSSVPHADASSKTSKSIRLNIFGLQDIGSAQTLEDTLRQKNGIVSATVDFTTSRATITYNSRAAGVRTLVGTIEQAGYSALVANVDENNAQLESLAKTKEIQQWKSAFLFSLSFAIPVFIISMILPMYLKPLDFGSVRIIRGLYLGDVICLLLTIPVQFGIGKRFYISSYKSLKHRSPTMDVLVTLGTSAAFFFSVFSMVIAIVGGHKKRPSTVFDTSTMLITFITLGRWLESRAKGQTSRALSQLMSLAPSMATIYEDTIAAEKAAEEWNSSANKDDASEVSQQGAIGHRVIPTELIEVGDVLLLRPGDKVPADGIVLRGESYLDESMITGEARPIHKKKGDTVIAGTVNGAGSLDVKVTRAGSDTQLSQIVKLVQDAQTNRAPIQRMADVVAGYFVPVIIGLGLLTFIGWMILSHILPHPPQIFLAEDNGGKMMVCLKLCISVIVFACPCALGLSTPTAVMVGTGVGAQHGILVKGGAVMEAATKITHVVFDKTGTLTQGKMSVAEAKLASSWKSSDWHTKRWWQIVGLAEMNSEHPIAKAVVGEARRQTGVIGDDEPLGGNVATFEVTVGKGVSAIVEPASGTESARHKVLIGNAVFLNSNGVPVSETIKADELSVPLSPKPSEPATTTQVHVAIDGQYAGTITLQDSLKPGAVATVAALHRMGLTTSIMTGDTYAAALATARAVGIGADSVRAGVSPTEKQDLIKLYQSTGDRVAMVGDGINDSPALASADVGIALSSGTDVAMEAADIVLMRSDDLLSIPASLCLARSIFNRIKLNLMWACVYNLIGLPFAMGLFLPFGGIALPPMAAAAAMALSSVSVVGSSLLLRLWKRPKWLNLEQLEKDAPLVARPSSSARDKLRQSLPLTALASLRAGVTRLVFGKKSRRAREEEGYVPLQVVEP